MTERERAYLIRDYAEITIRPDFDPNCIITKSNLAHLIHPYDLNIDVICHVLRPIGRCGHKHRDGVLGKTVDGMEGLIGGHCAKIHFKDHQGYQAERIRISRQIEFDDLKGRYDAYAVDEAFHERFANLRRRLAAFQVDRGSLYGGLGARLHSIVEGMAKSRSTNVVVKIRVADDENNDGELVARWEPRILGVLQGAEVFDLAASAELSRRLDAVAKAIRELRANPEPRPVKLKSTVRALDSLSTCEPALLRLERALERFVVPENLELVCFLTELNRADAAHFVLDQRGEPKRSRDVKRFLSELDNRVRASVAPRGFTIP
jgi:hypothetical protein